MALTVGQANQQLIGYKRGYYDRGLRIEVLEKELEESQVALAKALAKIEKLTPPPTTKKAGAK